MCFSSCRTTEEKVWLGSNVTIYTYNYSYSGSRVFTSQMFQEQFITERDFHLANFSRCWTPRGLRNHYSLMMNFIRTEAVFHLCWVADQQKTSKNGMGLSGHVSGSLKLHNMAPNPAVLLHSRCRHPSSSCLRSTLEIPRNSSWVKQLGLLSELKLGLVTERSVMVCEFWLSHQNVTPDQEIGWWDIFVAE